jgi:large subunit ribosomal protein L21
MYAIIETGGKQLKVKEGDIIRIEKLSNTDNNFNFDKILAVGDGENLNFGKPYVEGAYVEATILSDGRAKKIVVYKYKSKKGFHKKKGHRQPYTQVKIGAISLK